MPSSIAFFPWLSLSEPITIGPLRLLSYERGKRPGDLPGVEQKDLDAVLKAYALRPRKKVSSATVLELGTWKSGDDSDGMLSELFLAKELIAFSALSRRRFFSGHFDYTNYDSYALTVQRFQPGQGDTFAFTTRRRDGGSSYLWGSDEFAFHIPTHVASDQEMRLDTGLINALLTHAKAQPNLTEAIREFNAANTDSSIVPPHVEMVMMKSAWEALLQIDQRAVSFETALVAMVGDAVDAFPKGPLTPQWQASSARSTRVLAAWAREFCKLRGVAAHGTSRTVPSVWSEQEHLLFCAVLFPLAIKKILSAAAPKILSSEDSWNLANIDKYLVCSPLSIDMVATGGKHPWIDLDSSARWSRVKW